MKLFNLKRKGESKMKVVRIIKTTLIVAFFCDIVSAQNIEQENITVLPFSGWQSSNTREIREYQNILTDKIVTRIIKSHRFNVIDRSHLDQIIKEQNLQLSGAIDEATMVQMGRIIGVEKFITGSFTRNSTEYHKEEYYEGKKIMDAYYTSEINATIKLLDVETGMYIEATEAIGTGRGNDNRNALLDALEMVANNVISGFEEYFKIQAFITKIDKSIVYLDRGTTHGINTGMSFEVYDIIRNDVVSRSTSVGANVSKIGKLKIVSTESQSSKGRMFGDFSQVSIGNLIRETKEEIKVEAIIIEKSFGKVIINAGADLGLNEGSTFNVIKKERELIDPITGEVYGMKTKKIGLIHLNEVGQSYARGEIIKGRYSIDEGMYIKETEGLVTNLGFSISYGIFNATTDVNNTVGDYTVTDKYTGSHNISVNYSKYTAFTNGTLIKASLYGRDLARNYSAYLNFDIYKINDNLSAWSTDLCLSYYLGILPEYIYITPGLGIGFGNASQELPGNIVGEISNGEDKSLSALSVFLTGNIGARITLNNFIFWGEMSYRTLNFSEWKYAVATGTKDDNGNDETESITLNNVLVPYPKISMPIFINVGFSYEFSYEFSSEFPYIY